MKYIGNFAYWIDPLWEHLLLTREGKARPRDWPPFNKVEEIEYKKYSQAGYDISAVNWWVYEYEDIFVNVEPPWTKGKIQWWFTKLMPGQYMPMHTDPHTHELECNRFWIPIQNYHPGHIFIYKDQMITNYKCGDVYQYETSTDIHGAANIGYIPRLVLQITEYLQ